jgi:hypothetical protein
VIRATSLSLVALLAASASYADTRYKTEFGFSYSNPDATSYEAFLGYAPVTSVSSGTRIMTNGGEGDVRFEYHVNFAYSEGNAVSLLKLQEASSTAPPATLFNLTNRSDVGANGRLTTNLDRAWLSFTTDQTVLRVGRQAITWGQGTVFHPGDFVAPFSPSAIDTSFKPGVDMVYGQYLFDSGADIQAIYVPRPETVGGGISRDASTLALRGSASLGMVDAAFTLAEDRGDQVTALGLSGSLAGLGLKAEIVDWALASGTAEPSWLVSVMNFGSLGDWNTTYFAEYYHNGFGTTSSTALDALPAPLLKRMSTGQVFYAGSDFLALGGSIGLTPDLGLTPSAIISLEDRSAILGLAANVTIGDNANLSFSVFKPVGDDGTEFGGRETSSGSGVYVGASPSISFTATQYF